MAKDKKLLIAGLIVLGAALIPYRISKDENEETVIQSLAYKFTNSKKDNSCKLEIPGTAMQIKLTDVCKSKVNQKTIYDRVVDYTLSRGKVSAKALARHFDLGKASAEAYIDMMIDNGIIEPAGESEGTVIKK
ncbi:MAG: hypothetical protein J5850_06790 [Clostridia bacterium]|nr:hypothetical protein [Clostridia bacterium]